MMKLIAHPYRKSIVLVLGCLYFYFCLWNSALLEPRIYEQHYILALVFCALGMLVFAFGRIAIALFLSGTAILLLKFISVTKLQFLRDPLMPADFVYFANNSLLQTVHHYPHLLWMLIAACILLPLLAWAAWYFDFRVASVLRRWWLQASIRVVGVVACTFALLWCLQPTGPFPKVYQAGLWSKLSSSAHLTNFFVNIHNMSPVLPAMSSPELARKNWAATAKNDALLAKTPHQQLPDIIMVLEESTFNPANFAGCISVPQCHVPMFTPDQNTKAHGLLRVHTFGGGTWVSEFAALTGMPQDIFGSAGMYAPYVLAPGVHDSMPRWLDKLGYETIAIYPTGANFMNARNAYKNYGVDKFYDDRRLGLTEWHETDSQMFAAAKKVYDENKKPGKPIFMMIVTLKEHGPHDTTPLEDLPPPFNQGILPGLNAVQELNLSTYVSRLQGSNAGMALLEHDFLDRPHNTVITWFGDHQPSFSGVILGMQRSLPSALRPYKDHLTYFSIKSNFPGPTLTNYPMTDIAFLPAMTLNVAGLPKNSYFSALSSLQSRCNGLYEDCTDKTLMKSYYAWTIRHLGVYQ